MLENRTQPVISRKRFAVRVGKGIGVSLCIILLSLVVGISGYHFLENLPLLDSLLNASMILGGMGPVDPMHSAAGKLFASFYALYSGLVIIAMTGIILAPGIHRIFHILHSDSNIKE